MQTLDAILARAVGLAWGPPLVILLVGGGLFLALYSRLLPYKRLRESLSILFSGGGDTGAEGDITQFQAVSTALAATVGMGNIGGVAIAITQGGPGALFWMWVAAIVGMATKFFSCSLAVMYRGRDSMGRVQGGPMYYIVEGMGSRFRPLAVFFSVCGMVGCLSLFQSNQLAEILLAAYQVPPWATGVGCMVLVSIVMFGGVARIARVASALVPSMCLLYFVCALVIVAINLEHVPTVLAQIFSDAFTGTAAAGGAAGIGVITVIQTGVKRAAFSNEAGIGTAPMAHGAARTAEPIREGLVAMIEPVIDTVIVCSLTAIVILTAGDWRGVEGVEGVALTLTAFEASMGTPGRFVLMTIVTSFAVSTMFGYSYYGKKCFSFVFGAEKGILYDYVYVAALLVGAVFSAAMVVNLVDTAFAMMAIPNMIATLYLAPRVLAAARRYFAAGSSRRTGPGGPHN